LGEKFTIFFAVCIIHNHCFSQQEGMEHVIKDTQTLKEYRSKATSIKLGGNIAILAQTYKRIGDYYYKTDTRDSTMHYYKQALQQYDLVKDSFNISYCSLRIGELTRLGNDLPTSLSWSLPAADWFERHGKMQMAAHANLTISDTYNLMGNMRLRRNHLSKSVELNKLLGDTLLDLIILLNYTNDLVKEKKWEEVLPLAQRMINISRAFKQNIFLKAGLVEAGKSLYNMGRPEKAIPLLKECLTVTAISNRNNVATSYQLLTRCYIQLGDKPEAEKYLSLYIQANDSTVRRREKDNYEELLLKYESEKKANAILLLENDNKLKASVAQSQRRLIIGLTTGLLVLLAGIYIFFSNSRKRKRLEEQLHFQQENFTLKLQKEKEEKLTSEFNKQLAEVQLTALSAQMNPHFIFNCMNSIQKYVLKNEKNKALTFLQNFSELMRNVLDNSIKEKVVLYDEIQMLEKYILLEQQRLDNKFDYKIDLDPGLQTDFFEIPGMLIQPYVENAIWHGLMNLPDQQAGLPNEKGKKGFLMVSFKKEDQFIKCIVEDNGVGRKNAAEIEKEKSPKRRSFGMAISQKRLELMKMENQIAPEISIEDLEDKDGKPVGTRVTLFIQCN
jgi:hypothetical protein